MIIGRVGRRSPQVRPFRHGFPAERPRDPGRRRPVERRRGVVRRSSRADARPADKRQALGRAFHRGCARLTNRSRSPAEQTTTGGGRGRAVAGRRPVVVWPTPIRAGGVESADMSASDRRKTTRVFRGLVRSAHETATARGPQEVFTATIVADADSVQRGSKPPRYNYTLLKKMITHL